MLSSIKGEMKCLSVCLNTECVWVGVCVCVLNVCLWYSVYECVYIYRTQQVFLTNFALGKHLVHEDDLLSDQRGSLAYVSPDVISGKSLLFYFYVYLCAGSFLYLISLFLSPLPSSSHYSSFFLSLFLPLLYMYIHFVFYKRTLLIMQCMTLCASSRHSIALCHSL